ncbi:serine hydrolase [Candidatus Bathyarchaeota archaeon]|nr:serine hydrolase [Candidatus Bathyarchaeota archaeon]
MTFKDRVKELESYIFKRMGESGVVGLSVATIKDGQVNYKRGFGFRDYDKGTSADPDTLYCIGSVTKTFTALAVLQLSERGLLSLDDPIDRYVEFNAEPMGEPILVRHLLSHSSGLPSLGYAEATLGAVTGTYEAWFPISSPRDLLVFMDGAEDWVLAKPGQRHAYLNEGYIMLGSIIEEVSGQGYSDYVTENILEPLGMLRSTYLEEDVDADGDVATPYVTNSEGEKEATRYPYGQMISDGGLMSTAVEMARYLRMLMNGGELDGRRIAEAETIREAMAPKIKTVEEPYDGEGQHYYGYGLRIKSGFLGHDLIHHSGSVYGSSGYMGFIPGERVGVVVLANGGYYLQDIGEYALALLMGRDSMEAPYFRRVRALDDLTGTYTTFRGTSSYEVTRSGGVLQLTMSYGTRSYTVPMIPVDLEGEPKRFNSYGMDAVTPVLFMERDGETFMVYDRTMARRSSCG